MKVHLNLRNESGRKGVGLFRRDTLASLAQRVCQGENLSGEAELSLLFCTDAFIQELNRNYRHKNAPTDVLSFGQPKEQFQGIPVLGDIVISLDTVDRYCKSDRLAMRDEIRLLFCHGLLHLLGAEHQTKAGQLTMHRKQAMYLYRDLESTWH
jgi:probable rRNA maturation factor